jgi:hypothetical protein
MRLFSIIAISLFANIVKSQVSIQGQVNPKAEIEYPPVLALDSNLAFFCILEEDATIDFKKWNSYLVENLTLDSFEANKIPLGTYRLIAHFIIDTTGCITQVKIINDPGFGLGNKISNVLCANKICWIPANRNGRKIKNFRSQSFTFIVGEEESCEELTKGFIL